MGDFNVAANGGNRRRIFRSHIGWTVLGLVGVASLSILAAFHRQGAGLALADHDHGAMLMEAADDGSNAQAGRPMTTVQPPLLPEAAQRAGQIDHDGDRRLSAGGFYAAASPSRLGDGIRAERDVALATGGRASRDIHGRSDLVQPPGAIHVFAENASATEPAQLLAIFVADNDCGALLIPD